MFAVVVLMTEMTARGWAKRRGCLIHLEEES